jgi:hypothetical protein
VTHEATVLTKNLKDFNRVPGLRVEDWTVSPVALAAFLLEPRQPLAALGRA